MIWNEIRWWNERWHEMRRDDMNWEEMRWDEIRWWDDVREEMRAEMRWNDVRHDYLMGFNKNAWSQQEHTIPHFWYEIASASFRLRLAPEQRASKAWKTRFHLWFALARTLSFARTAITLWLQILTKSHEKPLKSLQTYPFLSRFVYKRIRLEGFQ